MIISTIKASPTFKYLHIGVTAVCLIILTLINVSCDDDDNPDIEYPLTGFYGDNILVKQKTEFNKQENSFNAKVPTNQKLKIIMTAKTAVFPAGTGIWRIESGSANNLAISKFDMTTHSQIFQSIDGGLTCDARLQFDKGSYKIDYYENDSLTPTATKTIVVNY
jgi:hypothetical protein